MQISKYILPVVVGAMAGVMLISAGETGLHKMYPEMATDIPPSAFLFLAANYILCSFLAGIIATLVAQRITAIPCVVVGIVLTFGGLFNSISMHHPLWFTILNLFIYFPFSYLGYIVAKKKEPIF